MKKQLTSERASMLLFIAAWIAYAVICLSKNAYSASIASIVQDGIMTKPKAGLINSAYWAFYGGAQLLGVKLIDRISPIHFITAALAGSAVVNLGMALSHSFGAMIFFWSLCGLLQFATWPSLVRLLVEYLIAEHKKKAMLFISFAQCVGVLFNYLSAAAILKFADWNMIFVISIVIIVATLVFWILATKKSVRILSDATTQDKPRIVEKDNYNTSNTKILKLMLTSGLLFVLVPSFMRAALDNGLKSWVPTMISESYGVSASFSNVLTTVLVLINLSGVFICSFIYPKHIKNVVTAFGACFAVVIPMTVALLFIGKIPLFLVVVLLTGITTMMYAGYQMNYVIIPAEFSCYGKSGSIASVLNAIASFGVLSASFVFGFLAEHTGWTGTVIAWIIMAVVATICCLIASPLWNRFIIKHNLATK